MIVMFLIMMLWLTILLAITVASRKHGKRIKSLTDALVDMQTAYNTQIEWKATAGGNTSIDVEV